MEPFFRRKRNKGGSQGSVTPPMSTMSISAPTISPTGNDSSLGHVSAMPMSPSQTSGSWTEARNSSLSASSTVSSRMSNYSDGSSSLNFERPSEQAVLDEMLEQIMVG
jgi:hypothetical protein